MVLVLLDPTDRSDIIARASCPRRRDRAGAAGERRGPPARLHEPFGGGTGNPEQPGLRRPPAAPLSGNFNNPIVGMHARPCHPR